jgi:protein phosphatase 1 regulatory subunit 37
MTDESQQDAVPEQKNDAVILPVMDHPLLAHDSGTLTETVADPVDSKAEVEMVTDTAALSLESNATPEAPPSSDQTTLRTKLLPHRQKKKQPKRGILKAPPPPVKPGLGGKLRDALGSIHPKFLDYTVGPIGNGNAAAVMAESIPPSISVPVNNLASNVMEGVGVVGGAAAAVVGSWGGRFGKFVGASTGGGVAESNPGGSPASNLPWKFATRMGMASSPANANASRTEKELPSTPTRAETNSTPLAGSPLQVSNESTTITIITDTYKPLKRASFILPAISITYPISSTNPPWSDKVLQDRKQVEESATMMMRSSIGAEFWNGEKLVELYEIACKGREEIPRAGIRQALSVGGK